MYKNVKHPDNIRYVELLLEISFKIKNMKDISRRNINQSPSSDTPSNILWMYNLFLSYIQKCQTSRRYLLCWTPIGNIFQNKEYFEKYFKEKYHSELILQLFFKYFVNQYFIPKLYTKMSNIQTISAMNGLKATE